MQYGFIGCGNMGSAIARALAKTTSHITISDRSGKARQLAQDLGITYTDNATIAENCSCIFIGVKPHMVADCLAPLRPLLAKNKPLLISMAAGVEVQQIEAFAGTALPVIRIMPNTPTAIGKGVIPYCCNNLVSPQMLADFCRDMRFCGLLDPLEERLIDAASALSGSGPAYMYVFLEALADGAVACGLPREKALQYAAMTMAGAAEMVLQSGMHPGALKDAVCSPGGSTIQGLLALEQHGFRGAAMDCVMAAYAKNKELGK